MTVKSLMELAAMACIKNIKALESIGDYLPYEAMRHILVKIDSAYQLRQIELKSPQIQGETGELWVRLIEKDFPLEYKANAYKPSSPDKWYRVWEKYKKEQAAAIEESEKKLKNALAGLKENKEKNTSKIVERKFLPSAGRVGPRRVPAQQRDHGSSTLTFNAGSRTKTHNGASVMRKVRREVKEIANIHGPLSRAIRPPTRPPVELKKAPAAMVDDYQRAAQPRFRGSASAPEPVSAVEQYEQRATVLTDSSDDVDDYDCDGIVGEPEKRAPAATGSSPAKTAVSDAAKFSLLKKKPTASRTQQPTKVQPNTASQKHECSGAPGTAPGSRGTANTANKFRRAPAKPSVPSAGEASSPSPTLHPETGARISTPRMSPAPESSAGPPLPKDSTAAPGTDAPPQHITRKRKAVDIFMHPKKRVL